MKKLRNLLKVIIFASLIFNNHLKAETLINKERELLSSAIKIQSSISNNDDIRTRITKRELALKKIDQILDKYSGTEIGLEILTTGNFANYNVNDLRRIYLNELIGYSLKICKSNPSSNCLGFVSLDNGNKLCENPLKFEDYITASDNFKNAFRVLNTNKDKNKFDLAVISSYINCSNNAQSIFGKDYINSRLLDVLLEKGEISKAKGITQNMKTPIFKIIAAADIRIKEGKYDYATFNKLLEKARSDQSLDIYDLDTVTISLVNKFYRTGKDPFSKPSVINWSVDNYLHTGTGYYYKCNEKNNYVAELAWDSKFLEAELFPRRRYLDLPSGWLALGRKTIGCENDPKYNRGIIYSLLENGLIDQAKKMRSFQKRNGHKDTQLIASYLDEILTKEQIIQIYLPGYDKWLEEQKDGSREYNTMYYYLYPYVNDNLNYKIYKILTAQGEYCVATNKLFRELRGTKFEAAAVLDMLNIPQIISGEIVCGDSDLDLLIE